MLLVIVACEDNLRDLSFIDSIAPPTNVSAVYDITQDNTGLVTISPSAEGAVSFEVQFGDTTKDPAIVSQGDNVQHTYKEGTYQVKIIASNVKGDKTEATQQLVVSFKAPQNLVVVIENDAAISKQVNVTANADFATMFDFDSGETGVTQPVASDNIGNTINYQYATPGMYTIKVTAKGAAIETTEYSVDFEVTEILAPIEAAPAPPVRNTEDVISIFSDAYADVALSELPTTWSAGGFEAVNLNNDNVWKLSSVDFIGMVTNYAAGVDLSKMEMMHIDYWVPEGVNNELLVKIVNTVDGGEDIESLGTTVTGSWQSIDIDMTKFDDGNLANKEKITQLIIDSDGIAGVVYIDNFYFYKAPTSFAKVFDDFEGNGTITTWAEDAAGLDIAFANPFVDATNGSATVLKYEDTGGQYANIRFDVAPNFDFSVKKSFSLKVYVPSSSVTGSSPNQVSLKLQDNTNSQPWTTQTEIIKPIQLDTWQTLTFDFENDATAGAPNPLSRTDFNRVILQVNGENNNDNVVAYFDDVEWGDDLFVGPIPQDDFEGNGNITTWAGDAAGLNTSFANPLNNSDNSSDTVLEYDDTGGQYANIRFDNEANANFNMNKHTFSLKIYVPSSSVSGSSPNQISLKLQDNTNGQPWTTQTEVIKPIELDKWQTVVFDFKNDTTAGSPDPLIRTNFNRVVLQVNGENNNDPVKAYIDDFKYY